MKYEDKPIDYPFRRVLDRHAHFYRCGRKLALGFPYRGRA